MIIINKIITYGIPVYTRYSLSLINKKRLIKLWNKNKTHKTLLKYQQTVFT